MESKKKEAEMGRLIGQANSENEIIKTLSEIGVTDVKIEYPEGNKTVQGNHQGKTVSC